MCISSCPVLDAQISLKFRQKAASVSVCDTHLHLLIRMILVIVKRGFLQSTNCVNASMRARVYYVCIVCICNRVR